MRAVCRRSELNPRYFYESFASLDDLLVAVIDETWTAELGELLLVVDGAPDDLEAKVRAAVEHIARRVTDDPRRARVLLVEGMGNGAVARRRFEVAETIAEVVAREAVALLDLPDDPAIRSQARTAASLLVGGVTQVLTAWTVGRLEMPRDDLVDAAVAFLLLVGERGTEMAGRSKRRTTR